MEARGDKVAAEATSLSTEYLVPKQHLPGNLCFITGSLFLLGYWALKTIHSIACHITSRARQISLLFLLPLCPFWLSLPVRSRLQQHVCLPTSRSSSCLWKHTRAPFERNADKICPSARRTLSGHPPPARQDHRGEIQGQAASEGKAVGLHLLISNWIFSV